MDDRELIPDVDQVFPPYEGFSGKYYRRRKKREKPKVQFFSHKNSNKKHGRVMWIHKTKKKRKSRLAKTKYTYNEEEGYGLGDSSGQVYDSIIAQKKRELKKMGSRKGQISFNEPSLYPEEEVSYRRKPKIVWLRNKKR